MSRLVERGQQQQLLETRIADATFLQSVTLNNSLTSSISSWLDRLKELHGVPFNYLVPNPHLLPEESIRFFNVDFNWLFALMEGACSIGQATSSEKAIHAATVHRLRETAAAPDAASGFIMRSQVVAGWPRLEVVAYDAGNEILGNVIRMDRITESILLFLVEGQIDHVIIREPAVGLHFGIDIKGGKPLRYVTVPKDAPAGTVPGDQIKGANVAPKYRDAVHRTIKMNELANDLSRSLYERNADNSENGDKLPFTSAEFALQLVEGTQEVTFLNHPSSDGDKT